jgi:acyl CoA:acetate/3-ketoacid CoA transferase alpha subunit/acyl CoA:acetate/3-ketoacid CoA transferase beta subunit
VNRDYADVIARRLEVPAVEGPDKVMPLAEAVRRFVAPGQTIYVGGAHGRPSALVRELVRQWSGRRPGWTLALTGIGSPWTALVTAGLVRRIITTFVGEGYPFPVPQKLIGAEILAGRLAVQNWSMLTLPLRLLAGALGVPFLPTRSLLGSSMEEDNARDGDFATLDDPLGSGERVGLVGALRPDVALFHAWAADRAGNVLAGVPLGDNFYGAMAARGGAIVSVERVVPTEVIRRHAPLVRLPGQYVAAVVEAPYGSHPGGMWAMDLPEFRSYAEDLDFIVELRRAFRTPETAEAWTREWMLEVPDQAAYVDKLGARTIAEIERRARPDFWRDELESLAGRLEAVDVVTPSERMVSVASRILSEKVRAHGYRTYLAGVGNSNLAAWLSAYELKAAGVEVELMAEVGMLGYAPRPAEPFVFSFRNFPSCKMLTDIVHTMGIFMGGAENRCLGSLAAGQIDKHGNINSTIVPGALYITGSGGANDIASSAREVVVTLAQSPARFVDKTPYVTAPGARVSTVVSDLAVFEKVEPQGELILTGLVGDGAEGALVATARERCGWDVKIAPTLRRFAPPTGDELRLMRLFDPRRYFLGDA